MQKLSNVNNKVVLECRSITKEFYPIYQKRMSLREKFIQFFKGEHHHSHPVFSLREFNLKVYKGESLALIGSNGSGKSTVLRLMAGIYEPGTGMVITGGRVGAVIELGAGFHGELTGSANIELYGAILGLTRRERAQRYQKIVEFSEIKEYIRIPVKYYSPGMAARLAFAVAIFSDPDILLLDEILAVGDYSFKEKCLNRVDAFRASGKTLVITSHDRQTISKFCTRAVWLDQGCIRMEGEPEEVLEAYYKMLK